MVDFQPLSKRSKNIASKRERGKHTYRRVAISPLCTILPQQHPHPCPWRHYTGNVTDKQADRCSPMSRRLVCGVCPEASRGLDVLQAQGGGGFPGKLARTWHGWQPRSEMEEEGSAGRGEEPLQLTSGASRWALTCSPGLWVGIRFWMRT